jgi:hypothetical protein
MEKLPEDPGPPEHPFIRAAYEAVAGRYSELEDTVYTELYDRACTHAIEHGEPLPDPSDLDAIRTARDRMLLEVRRELWFRNRAAAIERAERQASVGRWKRAGHTVLRWLRAPGY